MVTDIRLATIDDAAQIQTIYEPIVLETAISFEQVPPTVEQFKERITRTLAVTPWLVCDVDGAVAGYAYAGQYRAREAYQWSVEVTVYVAPAFQRRGVGRAVYASLFEALRIQGYRSAYAAIALPNDASISLHERLGFSPVGVFKSVGYKLGQWRDVGWWQLELQPPRACPVAPVPLPQVRNTEEFRRALTSGLAELR